MPGRDEGKDTRLFVEEDDICTSLEESVGSRETCETTTDDDNASHWGIKDGGLGEEERVGSNTRPHQ